MKKERLFSRLFQTSAQRRYDQHFIVAMAPSQFVERQIAPLGDLQAEAGSQFNSVLPGFPSGLESGRYDHVSVHPLICSSQVDGNSFIVRRIKFGSQTNLFENCSPCSPKIPRKNPEDEGS